MKPQVEKEKSENYNYAQPNLLAACVNDCSKVKETTWIVQITAKAHLSGCGFLKWLRPTYHWFVVWHKDINI